MKRLFVACLPRSTDAERVRNWFDAMVSGLRSSFRGDEARIAEALRITPPANWHLTLAFIGETDVAELPSIRAAVRSLPSFDFELLDTRIGAFSSLRTARVLWVGGEEKTGRLAELHERASAEVAPWVGGEKRSFHPHLTLARLRESIDLRETVKVWSSDWQPLPIRFGPVALFESVQKGETRAYRRLNLDG